MASPPIEVSYNESFGPRLTQLLANVTRPGDFFASGCVESPLPRLEIEGAGIISFPLPDAQALEIAAAAERAPYGRGENTLVDSEVRKVWQIATERVDLGGKTWDATFSAILEDALRGLGCEELPVEACLYKLLLYDEGSFFVSHRDTEKAEGMFATLVVVLPGFHEGGGLIIRHAGREQTIDLGTKDVSELNWAAFYADCEHEVLPVTKGNRLCLIYNLIRRPEKGSQPQTLVAPLYEEETAAAAKLLATGLKKPGPEKVAWLLEHQYSPAGLSFQGLKNPDAAIATVLSRAAVRAGCAAHLGIVHIEESGSAECYYDPSYKRRSRWHDDRESEEEDDDGSDSGEEDYDIVEVFDGCQFIDEWVNADGRKTGFGPIPLAEGELLPVGSLDSEPPDKERVTEATGNEGASFERSYHRAVIVLWREDRFTEVLLRGGVSAVLPLLKQRVSEWRTRDKSSKSSASWRESTELAKLMIDRWQGDPEDYFAYASPRDNTEGLQRSEMLGLLREMGEASMAERFIEQEIVAHYDGIENEELVAFANLATPKKWSALFATLAKVNMEERYSECAELLERLVCAFPGDESPAAKSALLGFAAAIVRELGRIEVWDIDHGHYPQNEKNQATAVDPSFPARLIDAFAILNADELGAGAARTMVTRPATYAPDLALIPALAIARDRRDKSVCRSPGFVEIWTHSALFLLDRSAVSPEEPADWTQPVVVSCNCEDCRTLNKFASDSANRVHRFPVNTERRRHLHRVIEDRGMDMTHETERKGRPYTLVCTKTRQKYLRRCQQYQNDIVCFESLIQFGVDLDPGSDAADLMQQMRTAIAKAKRSPDPAALRENE